MEFEFEKELAETESVLGVVVALTEAGVRGGVRGRADFVVEVGEVTSKDESSGDL